MAKENNDVLNLPDGTTYTYEQARAHVLPRLVNPESVKEALDPLIYDFLMNHSQLKKNNGLLFSAEERKEMEERFRKEALEQSDTTKEI